MAKRFIDTDFFRSPFVRSLKGPWKVLYCYIICDCSGAGIWTKDLVIAGAYTGFTYTEKDFEVFVQSGKANDLGNGKYFFPDFIEHQYPSGLQLGNKAHRNFILELQKYNLIDGALKVLRRGLEGSLYGSHVQVMVKEEVTGMAQVQDTVTRPKNSDSVANYMIECGINPARAAIESSKFWDYYCSNGWKVGGKAAMKDWKSATRTWMGRMKEEASDRTIFGKVKVSDIERQQLELNQIDNANSK